MKANEILVLSAVEAIDFMPAKDRETYIIRIFDQRYPLLPFRYPLNNVVFVDCFDFMHFDIVSGDRKADYKCILNAGNKLFTRRDANSLLDNFTSHFKEGMNLMVHCFQGRNRSPAVALALNDLFDLGHDYLWYKHRDEYDDHVYKKILGAALFKDAVSNEKKELVRAYLASDL